MTNVLSIRLKRLERCPALADPYAHLSEEQLADRIEEIDGKIEMATGMSVSDYSHMLEAKMRDRDPLPDGLSEAESRAFVAAIRNLDAMRPAYVE